MRMKKFFLFVFAIMVSLVANAKDDLVDGSLKVKVGSETLTIDEDTWYVVGNANQKSVYVSVADGKLVAGANPADQLAGDVLGQLVKFAAVDGGYTVMTATGEYWGTMTTEGTPTVAENAPAYTIGTASSRSNAAYFAQTIDETTLVLNSDLTGSTEAAPTTSKSNLSWKIYPVTLAEIVPVPVTFSAVTKGDCDKIAVSVKNEDGTYTAIESGAEFMPDNTIKVEASCESEAHYVKTVTVNNKSVNMTDGVYEFSLTDSGADIVVTFATVQPEPVVQVSEEDQAKNLKFGDAATSIEAGKWYVMYNGGRASYAYSQGWKQNMLNTETSPEGETVADVLGYLVKFEAVEGVENAYNIQTGLGDYWNELTQGSNNSTATADLQYYVQYKIAVDGDDTWFAFMGNNGTKVLDCNAAGGTVAGWGTDLPTETTSNAAWQLLPAEFVDSAPVAVTYTATTMDECDQVTVSVKNENETYTAIESGAEVMTGQYVKVEASCNADAHVATVTVDGAKVKLTNGAYEYKVTAATEIAVTFADKPETKTVYARVNKDQNWSNLPYEEDKDYYTVQVEVTGDELVKVINWDGAGDNLTVTLDPSTGYVTSIAEESSTWLSLNCDPDGQGYYGFYIYYDGYSYGTIGAEKGSLMINCYSYSGEQGGYPYINIDWYMDNRYDPSRPEPTVVDAKVLKTYTYDGKDYTNWSTVAYGEDETLATTVELLEGVATVTDWTGSGDKLTINYDPETGVVSSIDEAVDYGEDYGVWLSTTADIDNYASYPGCYIYYDGYSTANITDNGGLILVSCYSYNNEAGGYPYIIVQWGEDVPTGINEVSGSEASALKSGKYLRNGQVIIVKNGNTYNAVGQQVK